MVDRTPWGGPGGAFLGPPGAPLSPSQLPLHWKSGTHSCHRDPVLPVREDRQVTAAAQPHSLRPQPQPLSLAAREPRGPRCPRGRDGESPWSHGGLQQRRPRGPGRLSVPARGRRGVCGLCTHPARPWGAAPQRTTQAPGDPRTPGEDSVAGAWLCPCGRKERGPRRQPRGAPGASGPSSS